jgi:hypothetical protein
MFRLSFPIPRFLRFALLPVLSVFCVSLRAQVPVQPQPASPLAVLHADDFARTIAAFNAMEEENRANLVPNAESWAWLRERIPFFECSSSEVQEIYYYRWWALRKHLRRDDSGLSVFTEFLTKSRPVSSALGHHLAELRWLRDQAPVDDYLNYWLHGNQGGPQSHLHKYSGWLPDAVYRRFLATGRRSSLLPLLDDLVADYHRWETERQRPDGLFYQFDVWDAMEESISGSRTKKNIRPPLNSYQYGSALALSRIARLAGRTELASEFEARAARLRCLVQERLWDPQAKFFKVVLEDGKTFADVREELGFIPWYFELPEAGKGYEEAWLQLKDTRGFKAPYGIATAERRHPAFRSHGTGSCEWDGAVWPFATSQTLTALANVLHDYPQSFVSREDYFDAFLTYTRSQRYYGLPYIGEYLDEQTGQWLKFRQERSRYYNHSTYADLLITGLIGLCPREDDVIEIKPLLPPETWSWFCIDALPYHGHELTILFDARGDRYNRGKGFVLLIDGREAARSATLAPLTARIPSP